MYSMTYPGSGIEINSGWSLSTRLGGDHTGSPWGWMSLATQSLGNSLYQPQVPKSCPRDSGLVWCSLPCFAVGFVSVFNPQVQQHCLIWWEGIQNSGSKWASLPFVVMCITCMQLHFFLFLFSSPRQKPLISAPCSLAFSTIWVLHFAGSQFSCPLFSLNQATNKGMTSAPISGAKKKSSKNKS